MTRRSYRTAAVVVALLALLAPWFLDAGVAIHVAFEAGHGHEADHHDAHDRPLLPTRGLHGHAHDQATPPHEHGSSLPGAADHPRRSLAVTWTCGHLGIVPPSVAAPCLVDVVAPTPSPPVVTTTILRI